MIVDESQSRNVNSSDARTIRIDRALYHSLRQMNERRVAGSLYEVILPRVPRQQG